MVTHIRRRSFFSRIGEILSVSARDAEILFYPIREFVSENEQAWDNISFEHSRWVMINHTAKCFYLLGIMWIGIGLVHYFGKLPVTYLGLPVYTTDWVLVVDVSIFLLCVLIGARLSKMSLAHLEISNKRYLEFIKRNSEKISSILNLEHTDKDINKRLRSEAG